MAPDLSPEALRARVLFQDARLLVLDKPAGVPVHAGPSGVPSLEAALGALRFGAPHTPMLAHRLDRDTSGCLVLALHDRARRRLARWFSEGLVTKVYWAIVEGTPPGPSGAIEHPLAKVPGPRGWRIVVADDGSPAVTDYDVRAASATHAWVECRPRTGRTHQLRVHLAALGCPIVGDELYGRGADGLMLHARAITLPVDGTHPAFTVEAPIPAGFSRCLDDLGLA